MSGRQSAPTCNLPGCQKPTWNGKPGEYCSRDHFQKGSQPAVQSGGHAGTPYGGRAAGMPSGGHAAGMPSRGHAAGMPAGSHSGGMPSGGHAAGRTHGQAHSGGGGAVHKHLNFNPRDNEIIMGDPRFKGKQNVGVIAFYFPGNEEPCDQICQAGFLGNFYEFPGGLSLFGLNFTNSEAAFQSLKYIKSHQASQFQGLSGDDAFRKKNALGHPDLTYGGLGSNWKGMWTVLEEKFKNKHCADLLRKTGDAFLLEHNSVAGRDNIWSDNYDGTGTNWLGLQLMLIRDKLNRNQKWAVLGDLVDIDSGNPVNAAMGQVWKDVVLAANKATMKRLAMSSHPPGGQNAASVHYQSPANTPGVNRNRGAWW